MPELREIGLDPAVQGVPVKKKPSVRVNCPQTHCYTATDDPYGNNETTTYIPAACVRQSCHRLPPADFGEADFDL